MLAAAALALFLAAAPADQPPLPTLPQSAEVQLKLERDGSLSVAEAISVPNGVTMDRRVPLRVAAPYHRDRVYGVRDVVLEGSGTASVDEDAFTVHLTSGTSIVRYTVDGAVDGDRVTWELAGGWSTELKFLRASFAAPEIPAALDCLAGPPDSDFPCGAAQIDHAGLTRFSQQNLAAGQRMTATVELPAGTVPANAVVVPAKTIAGAFVLTAPVAWTWAAFGALLLLSAALLLSALRSFHVKAPLPGGSFHVKARAEGGFASPDGVLPGHVGVLLHGRPGPADLAATVLDLAVRNYLWVSAEAAGWRLTRRNPPDEHLTAFERAVFTAVVPGDSVTLAELRQRHVEVPRAELVADTTGRGWLRRSGRLGRAGVRVVFYGLFLTVLLALTAGYAQLGVVLALAGVAAVVAEPVLPARRRAGTALARRLRGLAASLASAEPEELSKPQRELVFSRGLPYASALGELAPWVAAFDALPHPPPVYWHDGDVSPDQAGSFATALAGVFAGARRARLLDTVGARTGAHPQVGTHASGPPS